MNEGTGDGGVTLDGGTLLVDGEVSGMMYERLLARQRRGGLNGSGEYDFMTGQLVSCGVMSEGVQVM
ncbi:hypothetical protein [Escherichia coli]|uniref:hypothetical protein n=1 Tax=Escherichia coli TaxID=562 RepID=UPI002035E1FC|nr:hypothetical protein [Escherichia coli]